MRHPNKKSFSLIFSLFFLLTLLSGCQSTTSGHEPESTEAFEETVGTTEMSEPSSDGETLKESDSSTEESDEPTTAAPPEEIPEKPEVTAWIEVEMPVDSIKTPVHTLEWGSGEGQVGYYKEFQGAIGPASFAVEDGTIYVLDRANDRVLIYRDGAYTEIVLGMYREGYKIKYQNQRIGVLHSGGRETAIYRTDGTLEARIKHPTKIDDVTTIKEIGDTYVVWDSYRYDWVKETLEVLEKPQVPTTAVSNDFVNVVGTHSDDVYYYYIDWDASQYVINRDINGCRLYTRVDYSSYRLMPIGYLYISEDGRLYIMECFEDRVVISELALENGQFDYVIDSGASHYRIKVNQITKDGGEYIVAGTKNGGTIVLTAEQKASLDSGAVMHLVCEGEEVDCITAIKEKVSEAGSTKTVMYYWSEKKGALQLWEHTAAKQTDQPDSRMSRLTRGVDLGAAPYNGSGYVLAGRETADVFELKLEERFTVRIPGEMPIEPKYFLGTVQWKVDWDVYAELKGKSWTMAEYYDMAVRGKMTGPYLDVYLEDGEIVGLYEEYRP